MLVTHVHKYLYCSGNKDTSKADEDHTHNYKEGKDMLCGEDRPAGGNLLLEPLIAWSTEQIMCMLHVHVCTIIFIHGKY